MPGRAFTWILWFFKAGWSKAGCFLMSMQSIISPSSLYKHEKNINWSVKLVKLNTTLCDNFENQNNLPKLTQQITI
jgi:uncharacterized protein YegP (UPF0339 family)